MDPIAHVTQQIMATLDAVEDDYVFESVDGDPPLVDWGSLKARIAEILAGLRQEVTDGSC